MINKDMCREILLKVESEETFLNFSTVNKYFFSLYDENLFRKRIEIFLPKIKKRQGNYKELYLYNFSLIKKLKNVYNFEFKSGDPEKYIRILSKPRAAAYQAYHIGKYGYEDLISRISPNEYSSVMSGAAHSGNLKLVNHFMNLGCKDYDEALFSAIKHNHSHIINLFLPLASDWRAFILEAEMWNRHELALFFETKI